MRKTKELAFRISALSVVSLIAAGACALIPMSVPARNEMIVNQAELSKVYSHSKPTIPQTKTVYIVEEQPAVMSRTLSIKEIAALSMLSRSGLTVEQLSSGLSEEMKPFAPCFIEIEREYGINAVMFAAICAVESGWGRQPSAVNNYMNFSSDGKHYYSFDTAEECFFYGAEQLKQNYLDKSGKYYNGETLRDVNIFYSMNPDGSANTLWYESAEEVTNIILNRIYNK